MEEYLKLDGNAPSTAHPGYLLRAAPDWDYLRAVRDMWDGPLVIKGVLDPEDAPPPARRRGPMRSGCPTMAGGNLMVHWRRLDALQDIRASVGPDMPLIYDGGVESGLDVLRALALGANFTMLGRGWHYCAWGIGGRGCGSSCDAVAR